MAAKTEVVILVMSVALVENLEKCLTAAIWSSSWKSPRPVKFWKEEPEIMTMGQALAAKLETPVRPWMQLGPQMVKRKLGYAEAA
ncbi:hypothetical protein ABFS82_05G075500 [Erythranthe guttata]